MDNVESLKSILDHIDNTVIYVIRQDNHEILYFNQLTKKQTPQVCIGAICHQLWPNACTDCPLEKIGEEETFVSTGYDPVMDCDTDTRVTRMIWGEGDVPAFLITVAPHVHAIIDKKKIMDFTLDAVLQEVFQKIIYVNLTKASVVFERNGKKEVVLNDPDTGLFLEHFNQGKKTIYLESRQKDQRGEVHWLATTAVRLEDNEIGDMMALILVTCIDEKKKLEQERQELIDSAMTLFGEIIILNLNNGHFDVYKTNDAMNPFISDYDFAYFNQQYGQQLVHPEDQEAFFAFFRVDSLIKSIQEGKSRVSLEVRRKDDNGVYRWSELIGIAVDNEFGELPDFVLTFRDIDDLRNAQQEQRSANRRFISAINNFYDAIYEGDLFKGSLIKWKGDDGTLCSFHLYESYDEHIKRVYRDYIADEYKEAYWQTFAPENIMKMLEGGKKEAYLEAPRKCSDGVYRWYLAQAQLIEKTSENARVMFCLKNIDESRREEERKRNALLDALEVARHANAAKTDFLSRMSHDIRTPMNAIIGMTAIASQNLENPSKTADCLNKIDISASFLLSLINDILDMSKIESGKMNINHQRFDFYRLIQEMSTVCREQARQKNQKFDVKIDEHVEPEYIGDRLRIHQVLQNLLGNAIKYTPANGHVSLKVTAESLSVDNAVLMMEIEDNGIGISQEFIEHLFTPFEQENANEGRTFEGSGLGLAITQNLIHLMNGSISVESIPGAGSSFTVNLPLTRIDRAAVLEEADSFTNRALNEKRPEDYGFNKENILVVEDNEINMEIAVNLLESHNLTADKAVDGQVALDKFNQSEAGFYSAILMDIRMPVMNGLEATKHIRRSGRPDALSIPVIAMTANAFEDEKYEAKMAGFDAYLTKPMDVRNFLSVLRKSIRNGEM